MKTEDLYADSLCSGCGGCVQACPVQAIQFKLDETGVRYPHIHEETCIDCRQCLSVCHYSSLDHTETFASPFEKITYAACGCEKDIQSSASGGIFYSVARHVLDAGGMVAGCVLEKQGNAFVCHHVLTSDLAVLEKMRGSKYVESDTGECFLEIRRVIREGFPVLFAGTPCQVQALRRFLPRHYDNLYCMDLICHGVPPIQLFNTYIHEIERKKNCSITEFRFRDKQSGSGLYGSYVYTDQSGKEHRHRFPARESSYYAEFLDGSTYRENCYTCPYASKDRTGDLSIGDFWNIDLADEQAYAEMSSITEDGISVITIQNEQGRKMIEQFGTSLNRAVSDYDKAAKYNRQMVQPSQCTERKRKEMLEDYSAFEQKYQRKYRLEQTEAWIRRMIPKSLKRGIRCLLKRSD